jgi:hypothetical protein
MKIALNRRELLALSGGAMMLAAAAPTPADAAASTGAGALPESDGTTVVLQDRRLQLPDEVRGRLAANGSRLLTLDPDPVRMWRGEHAALLQDASTRLLGVTPWIEFVMVRGLAAETRRRVRYQRFDADSNAMVWLIA